VALEEWAGEADAASSRGSGDGLVSFVMRANLDPNVAVGTEPTPTIALPFDPFGPDRDCGEFDAHEQAQAFFEAAGGPASDRHSLDGDNDGIACESLP
jgi:hypothetical protein